MQNGKTVIIVIALVVGIAVGFVGASLREARERGEMAVEMKKEKVQVAEIPGGPGAKATDVEKPKLSDLSELKKSKITLVEALKQVEAKYSPATEAKFETGDNGKLVLSIYTVENGINTAAAQNVFQELLGDPTVSPLALDLTTVTDPEPTKSSARNLTLVQTAGLTLRQAVEKVNEKQPGFVYFAIPTIRDGEPGYGVYTLDGYNKSHYFFVTGPDTE